MYHILKVVQPWLFIFGTINDRCWNFKKYSDTLLSHVDSFLSYRSANFIQFFTSPLSPFYKQSLLLDSNVRLQTSVMPGGEKLWGASGNGGHNLPTPGWNRVNWSVKYWGASGPPAPGSGITELIIDFIYCKETCRKTNQHRQKKM